MSSDHPTSQVLTRLSQLERQNKRLQAVVILGSIAVGLALFSGAKAPDATGTVKARQFVVVDAEGKHMAELGPKEDGEGVNLVLRDSTGEGRVLLVANDTDASLSLIEKGQLRGGLTARTGKFVLLVFNRDGFNDYKNQIGLGYTDDGSPMFFINDETGRSVTKLP